MLLTPSASFNINCVGTPAFVIGSILSSSKGIHRKVYGAFPPVISSRIKPLSECEQTRAVSWHLYWLWQSIEEFLKFSVVRFGISKANWAKCSFGLALPDKYKNQNVPGMQSLFTVLSFFQTFSGFQISKICLIRSLFLYFGFKNIFSVNHIQAKWIFL